MYACVYMSVCRCVCVYELYDFVLLQVKRDYVETLMYFDVLEASACFIWQVLGKCGHLMSLCD